jgi:phage terminase small subunit
MAEKKIAKKPAKTAKKITATPDMVQQRADFCRYYIEQDFTNATLAYKRAYNPQMKDGIAAASAVRLLRDEKVRAELSREIQSILAEKKIPLEKKILDTYMVRAFYDPTEIIDLEGRLAISEKELRERGLQVCIDSINKKVSAQGDEYTEYKLADRDKALDMLQKYIQMIKPFDRTLAGKDADGNPFSFSVSFTKPGEHVESSD